MRALLIACVLCLPAACRTIETRQVSSTPTPTVRVGTRARTWEVRSAGELVGRVVLFQEHGLARDSVYVVRNPYHQDLGLIDGLGRAYRYLPHHAEPAWVGSGTISDGTERILGLAAACELVEIHEPEPALDPDNGNAQGPAQEAGAPSAESAGAERGPQPSGAPSPDGGLAPAR